MSQAGILNRAIIPSGDAVQALTGNSGGRVGPDGTNNINIIGSGGVLVTGSPGTNTLTITAPSSAITITGDSGGPLVGNSFTFTGGTTGLTFAGAGTTETLGGTLIVSNGGTGRATSTAYAVICGGTTTTAAQQSVAALGASGTILTSNGAGALPTFQAAAASSISITGNSGGALTGNAFTFTGGTTGLTFAGAGTTETLGGSLAIANGGTNATSMATTDGTVYFDGTRLVTTATGSSGQILTSGGAGVAPAYAAAPASSISITGNTGGALTGNAFTFSGGTTGLSFGGSGTTETISGTLVIANGGTNATSMSTSTGIVKYDGTSLVTSSAAKIDSSNRMTNTSQPCFNVYLSADVTNVTGDGTGYAQAYDTKSFDQGTNYSTGTHLFTAPVTGRYHFSYTVGCSNLGAAHTSGIAQLVTTAQNYLAAYMNYHAAGAANNIYQAVGSWTVTMTAGDTASTIVYVFNGTKSVTAVGAQGNTSFSGYLVC